MSRVSHLIVKYRIWILAAAALLLIPSVNGLLNREIEYDLLKYLPNSLNSVAGLRVMDREYRTAERAIVVARNAPDWAVARLKGEIEQVDGVSSVFWLSDLADPSIPHDYLGDELVSQFYRGEITLLVVDFLEDSVSPRTEKAVRQIKDALHENESLIGQLVSGLELKDLGIAQTPKMIRAAVCLIFLVLLVTLPSPLLPVVFMGAIGLAYTYNMGIAHMLGQRVSYVTNSCAAAMQLGVTMDYCIFLMHSFQSELRNQDAEQAMEAAVSNTARAIVSSALTTAVGFAALALMKVSLGADLGLLLARGVMLSVVCCLTVLPSLVLVLHRVIDRWNHRVLLPKFDGLASWAVRRRVPVFAAAALIMMAGFYGYSKVNLSYNLDSTFPRDLPSIRALDQYRDDLGSIEEAYIIAKDVPGWKLQQMSADIRKLDGVNSADCLADVVDPAVPIEFVPEDVAKRYVAGDYSSIIVNLEGNGIDSRTAAFIGQVRGMLDAMGGESYLTGQPVIVNDLKQLTDRDMAVVDIVSMAAIFVIVAVTFRSVSVGLVLIGAIECAIWVNQAISYFLGAPMFFFSRLAISAIQLGATVDYAILIANTFRGRLSDHGPLDAMRATVAECAPAILSSGMALFAAIIGVYSATTLRAVKDLAILLARGSLVSTAVAIVLLPPALLMLHPLLVKTSISWPAGASAAVE
ncbi:MAG: MMPL family transporter [Clostridia bacterium]|nr:MMPL family transporter [Clostridia bacterium]